ncbi:MAG: GTPase HflX [Clostridia bacterium]|nr:GTPase HflX [Clostridia bacterium]
MHKHEDFNDFYEKAYLLFPIFNGKISELESRVSEMKELVKTAGAEVVGHSFQVLREISPATIFGSGKVQEILEDLTEKGANLVIFDGELSPSQAQNLSDCLGGIKFIDRTALILDIFALSAKTKEGKIQVELAQHEYVLSRLKGQGKALSRLGGGIGTRGPGETKLETDRRYIRYRIKNLRAQLEELTKKRNLATERRERTNTLTVAIAGYTNAGKSTLLNALSGSDVLAEDKLFATLDPTHRKISVGKFDVVLIDTVGFIKDIPTNLINAFKSTLDSVKNADLILNVCDATGDFEKQNAVTESILKELNANSPIIKVFNKCENISDFTSFPKDAIFISAKYKTGLDKLKDAISDAFKDEFVDCKLRLDFSEINDFYKIKDFLENYSIKYKDDCIEIDLCIKKIYLPKISNLTKKV